MSKIDGYQLLERLSTEHFTSGEDMANEFGVSRTAIAKQIKQLQELGIDIYSVQRRGYKLNNKPQLYRRENILNHLTQPDDSLLELPFVIDSTNDAVKQRASQLSDGFVCVAEAQKKGKGRQGKAWFSPLGSSIYLSMKWGFSNGFQSLSGLSLAIGVSIVRVVKQWVNCAVSLKWPNDVYLNGEKVAGILIEVSGNPDGSCDAIIGVGMNIRLPEDNPIDQPWTDLQTHSRELIDKDKLVAQLINEMRGTLDEFVVSGLSGFVAEWEEHDHFRDKPIKLLMGQNQVTGVACGISGSGALIVETLELGQQVRKEYFGGEISVRSA